MYVSKKMKEKTTLLIRRKNESVEKEFSDTNEVQAKNSVQKSLGLMCFK